MLPTTTTMGLRAISAAPYCTTRTILRNSGSPYSGTFCPLGLRSGSSAIPTNSAASGSASNNPLLLSSQHATTSPTSTPTAAAVATASLPSTIRAESTISSSPPPHSSPSSKQLPNQSSTSSSAGGAKENQPLDWQTFFSLRKSRRRYQVTFSTAGALGFSFGGALFLSSPGGETLLTYFPLDPFIGFGLGMTAFMALGWLLGPAVGNAVFYLRHSKWKAQMTKKEIELFARIKKNRVDPTASSTSNPVPDFYGEKIQSISDYRQWLKDQRAFNKKRTTFV